MPIPLETESPGIVVIGNEPRYKIVDFEGLATVPAVEGTLLDFFAIGLALLRREMSRTLRTTQHCN